jgi:tRNA threonylcarbamoyladenosine biosynthesis protein TsaB
LTDLIGTLPNSSIRQFVDSSIIIFESMLILALDTTTRAGSCALARDGRVLRELASDVSRPPASRLPGDLMTLLERERIALPDIDVYAVATGPGSFTGLRVGIATMQGLAVATEKPLIGVSAFDALTIIASRAGSAERTRRTATWIDAWRGEVYAALYENGREVEAPTVSHPDVLLTRLGGQPTLFVGDAAATYHDLIETRLGHDARFADPVVPLLAGAIATLASDAARAGQRPPPHAIRPLYVRRTDAELARDAKGL